MIETAGGLSLPERLTRIEGAIDRLSTQVTTLNATAARYTPEEVARYRQWQERVDDRLNRLEQSEAVDAAVTDELSSWKRWQIGQTIGIVTALAGVAGVFVVLIQHHGG